jgi:hypothetical protein
MVAVFGSFGAKSLSGGRKLVNNIYGNPNSPRVDKLFFLNLYKIYNLYIFNELLPYPLQECLSKVLSTPQP